MSHRLKIKPINAIQFTYSEKMAEWLQLDITAMNSFRRPRSRSLNPKRKKKPFFICVHLTTWRLVRHGAVSACK